eukprot:4998979-Ditylum_brightwellii.AAC.2
MKSDEEDSNSESNSSVDKKKQVKVYKAVQVNYPEIIIEDYAFPYNMIIDLRIEWTIIGRPAWFHHQEL